MKVTVVGAGNVGATCADVLAYREIANEVVLIDIKEGVAEGKALDIWQKAPINMYDTRTVGVTNDYVITSYSIHYTKLYEILLRTRSGTKNTDCASTTR